MRSSAPSSRRADFSKRCKGGGKSKADWQSRAESAKPRSKNLGKQVSAYAHLDRALQRWNEVHARQDETLAIDGKTLCNALDAEGHPTHVMSVVGHQTQICYTQKK